MSNEKISVDGFLKRNIRDAALKKLQKEIQKREFEQQVFCLLQESPRHKGVTRSQKDVALRLIYKFVIEPEFSEFVGDFLPTKKEDCGENNSLCKVIREFFQPNLPYYAYEHYKLVSVFFEQLGETEFELNIILPCTDIRNKIETEYQFMKDAEPGGKGFLQAHDSFKKLSIA